MGVRQASLVDQQTVLQVWEETLLDAGEEVHVLCRRTILGSTEEAGYESLVQREVREVDSQDQETDASAKMLRTSQGEVDQNGPLRWVKGHPRSGVVVAEGPTKQSGLGAYVKVRNMGADGVYLRRNQVMALEVPLGVEEEQEVRRMDEGAAR